MSLASVHVRARDGALYKNPLLVFEEGFLCFDDVERPEIVLWLPPGATDKTPVVSNVVEVLRARLGRAVDVDTVFYHSRSLRVVPDTEPWQYRPAIAYFLDIVARIPRPTAHEGTERYPRNCSGLIMDWSSAPQDANELEIPK